MQPDIIAKRIRKNLEDQKIKLEEYLNVLESQEEDIEVQNPDKLLAHIELEKNIIDELSSFKKMLIPLEEYYDDLPFKRDGSIDILKKNIDSLTENVNKKSEKNKLNLESVIENIKVKAKTFNKKKFATNSIYKTQTANILDISG